MPCTINYKSNKDLNILTRTFEGIITMTEIIASYQYIIDHKLINQDFTGIISDCRKTDFQVYSDDFGILEAFFQENINLFKNLKLAEVIDTPKIVIPMLFEIQFPQFKSKAFSTVGAAEKWINQNSID